MNSFTQSTQAPHSIVLSSLKTYKSILVCMLSFYYLYKGETTFHDCMPSGQWNEIQSLAVQNDTKFLEVCDLLILSFDIVLDLLNFWFNSILKLSFGIFGLDSYAQLCDKPYA